MKFLNKMILGLLIALGVMGLSTNSAEARHYSRHRHHHDHDRVVVVRSYPRYYSRPVYYGYSRPSYYESRRYYDYDAPRVGVSFAFGGGRHGHWR